MKILVVDDDPVSRCLLRQILTTADPGGEVVEACCGKDACDLLEKPGHGIDLAFLDISMPDLDGIELFRRFRANPLLRTLPMILCTSANDRPTVVKAATVGARHYIVKPAATSTVREKLRQIAADIQAARPAVASYAPESN